MRPDEFALCLLQLDLFIAACQVLDACSGMQCLGAWCQMPYGPFG